MPLVNPGTGAEPGYESCACDGVREARNTVEGGLNPFGAVLEPIAGMVWRLVADEASAPLAFGNWSLLETLDRLHAVPGRDPAVDTDGVPDEVIGIRILDGTASVRALERR